MLRFQDYHIQEIIKNEYNVVCDEELNLISNFDISKSDISFLVTHGLLEFGEQDGKVTFTDKEMSIDAKYGKVKQLADMGCLFAAKRKQNMLVTKISPRLIEASNRFILLTYQYDKSIMQTFMSMHGYSHKELVLALRYPPATIRKNLQELIEFVETPSIKKVRSKHSMSKSWWDITSTDKDRDSVIKAIRSAIKASGVPVSDVFYTLPKNRIEGGNKEKVNTSYIKKSNFLACSVRSTCEYNYKQLGVHAYALYPHQSVKAYMQDMGFVCNDDVYAINMLLQWLFRGCIRDGKPMKLAILSSKMNTLFKAWLMKMDLGFPL